MAADPGTLPAHPTRWVEDEIACFHCGYNLRMLRLDGLCPECGTAVSQTMRVVLRFADPQWVEGLATGVWWMFYAIALAAIVTVPVAIVILLSDGIAGRNLGLWLRTATVCLGMLVVPGYLRLTAREPGRRESRWQSFVRWSARLGIIAVFCVGLSALGTLSIPRPGVNPAAVGGPPGIGIRIEWALRQFVGASRASVRVQVLSYLFGIVGWFAMLSYLRGLAIRLPDRPLAHQTAVLMWCLIVSTSLITWVRSVPIGTGPGTTMAVIGGSGVAGIASAVSITWLVFLLLRYRDRFSEAAVQARLWSSRRSWSDAAKVQP